MLYRFAVHTNLGAWPFDVVIDEEALRTECNKNGWCFDPTNPHIDEGNTWQYAVHEAADEEVFRYAMENGVTDRIATTPPPPMELISAEPQTLVNRWFHLRMIGTPFDKR